MPRDPVRGESPSAVRLLFKKRLFREGDSDTPDTVYAALCYAQALVEYMAPGGGTAQGCTWEVAAELCALQMQGEYEQQLADQPDLIVECIRMCAPAPFPLLRPHFASIIAALGTPLVTLPSFQPLAL